MALELDHLFFFTDPAEGAAAKTARALEAAGLVPSYRRRHAGQGTANICYCFDNAFLELLFVVDRQELTSPAIKRTGFVERSDWLRTGGSPLGIGLRGGDLPGESWSYRFDGLPPGLTIPVSNASDDIRLPFIFGSPGTARPDRWGDGRAGVRQAPAGYTDILEAQIFLPVGTPDVPILRELDSLGIVSVHAASAEPTLLRIIVGRTDGGRVTIDLPIALTDTAPFAAL